MKRKGVTMVELIAVIAIMSIVFGIIYSIFSSGNMVYNKGMQETQLVDSSRSVFLALGEDIKKASTINIQPAGTSGNIPGIGSGQSILTLITSQGSNNIEYVLTGDKLYKVFVSTGNTTMIASNISSISITKSGEPNAAYSISVTISYKGKSRNFTTTVASRNRGL